MPEPETGAPPEAPVPVPVPAGAAPPVELLVAVEEVLEPLAVALDDLLGLVVDGAVAFEFVE